ncbi:MAG: hypothetical protein JWO06_2945 [Bacteroidota bacterium]|nr:hypothetical protein [Bacteroidota bacterium]
MKRTLLLNFIFIFIIALTSCNHPRKFEPTNTIFKPAQSNNQETTLFKLDDSNTRFKLTKVMAGNIFVYTIDSVSKQSYTLRKDNTLIATELISNTSNVKEIAEQVVTKLKNSGATNMKVSEPVAAKTREATITESEIQFELEGDKMLIYLAVADNGKHKIEFQGSVHSDIEANKQDFKNLARSITFPVTGATTH